MKYLILLSLLFLKASKTFTQDIAKENYRVEFSNTKFLEYDTTKKNNIKVEGFGKSEEEQKLMAELLPRAFFNSIGYTYDVVNQTITKDSSKIVWSNFKSSSKYLKIDFSTQEYFYSNKRLTKKKESYFVDVNEIANKKESNLWRDSVIYTHESILINGYNCIIAVSVFSPDRKYFICRDLPSCINPGIVVVNSRGAILGFKSDNYSSTLKKIEIQR